MSGAGIYGAFSFNERDPLFGVVYIWVLYGIYCAQPEEANLIMQFLVTYSVFLTGITAFCIDEKIKGRTEKGLFL